MKVPKVSVMQALDYEVRASWWMSFVWFSWGHTMVGKYLAWKVRRKHRRYNESWEMQDHLAQLKEEFPEMFKP